MCNDGDAETCSRCYSFWCIGFGAILFGLNIVMIISIFRGSEPNIHGEPAILITFFVIGAVISMASIVAGGLLVSAMILDDPKRFRIGKILSYPAPIMYFFLVFPIVALVIGVLNLSEYRDERWPVQTNKK